MDSSSVSTKILSIMQLTSGIVGCLFALKQPPRKCRECLVQAPILSAQLLRLKVLFDEDADTKWSAAVQRLAGPKGPLDGYQQLLEGLQAKLSACSEMHGISISSAWTLVENEVGRLLDTIAKLKVLAEVALERDHIRLSDAVREYAEALREPDAPGNGGGANKEDGSQRHSRLMEWLAPSKPSLDFPRQHCDILGRRQPETGMWFLKSPEFQRYANEPWTVLFCPGIPGAGKTTISAIVVEHLLKTVQPNKSSTGVAYLYCNYKAQGDQTVKQLVAAVLRQLVQRMPAMTGPVVDLYDLHSQASTTPTLEEILDALANVIQKYYKTIYVVIDALDDCSQLDGSRLKLVEILAGLQGNVDLRLMATSRFTLDEIQVFSRPHTLLKIEAKAEDVALYVTGQRDLLPKCIQQDDELFTSVQVQIGRVVNGMFLLARLHVDSLKDKKTKRKVESAIRKMSASSGVDVALDGAYQEALDRVNGQLPGDRDLAKRVITWITHAQRPLQTDELRHALAVERGDTAVDPDNFHDDDDIVSACAGLVTIDEGSKIIRLVHPTAEVFFENIRGQWDPNGHRDILQTCLTYMLFDDVLDAVCEDDASLNGRLLQNKFLDYAARNWGRHMSLTKDAAVDDAMRLLLDRNLVAAASQVMFSSAYMNRLENFSQLYPKELTGLHLAAIFGLSQLADPLIDVVGADPRDQDDRTPLSWAAEYGHGEVVRKLANRVDVAVDDYKGADGRTPLLLACQNGHLAVASMLVDREDVDANAKDKTGWTPLFWAARNGHEAIVRLLLGRSDVNVDTHDARGQTPFMWAAMNGHRSVVILMAGRADYNAKDG